MKKNQSLLMQVRFEHSCTIPKKNPFNHKPFVYPETDHIASCNFACGYLCSVMTRFRLVFFFFFCLRNYSTRCLLMGNACVTMPMPLFLPSLNSIRWPIRTNSGRIMNRNSTLACSFVPILPQPMMPSMTAVCLILSICTVV